ncbi:MAG TPA: hypothetical protein VKY31_10240, partial [Terriglobia bacterium]|nr:hypothetical protein [Terriglobia bacterium]
MNIDEWFKGIREKYSGQMQCGKGCTACCHGLFDISLADAVDVARGFDRLPEDVQQRVLSEAKRIGIPGSQAPTLFAEDDPR